MASIKLEETKTGKRYFKISVSRGRGKSNFVTRWYWPEGWSKKVAEREAQKQAAMFEMKCKNGEILNRAQAKEKEEEERKEAAKLKSVRQYVYGVFLPSKDAALSENSRSTYRLFCDKHILPVLGDTLLIEVTPAMLTKLLIDFQKAGYAHASVIKLYNILNGIFEMAFLDDSIPMNPLLKVKRPAPRKDERIQEESEKALTVEELRHVLACADQEPLKWRVYVHLSADTGIRRGEACGLQWSDIDFRNAAITVRRNLQYTAQAGVYATSPKNGKIRVVDVGPETLALLRRLLDEQSQSCLSKWVFSQDGTADPMHPQSPTRYFKRFGEKYGLKNFHPHLLRHTSASVAITNGGDVVSVSQRLGHSDTAVTLRMYAHANEESIRRAGQVVRDVLKEKTPS